MARAVPEAGGTRNVRWRPHVTLAQSPAARAVPASPRSHSDAHCCGRAAPRLASAAPSPPRPQDPPVTETRSRFALTRRAAALVAVLLAGVVGANAQRSMATARNASAIAGRA